MAKEAQAPPLGPNFLFVKSKINKQTAAAIIGLIVLPIVIGIYYYTRSKAPVPASEPAPPVGPLPEITPIMPPSAYLPPVASPPVVGTNTTDLSQLPILPPSAASVSTIEKAVVLQNTTVTSGTTKQYQNVATGVYATVLAGQSDPYAGNSAWHFVGYNQISTVNASSTQIAALTKAQILKTAPASIIALYNKSLVGGPLTVADYQLLGQWKLYP